MGKEFANDLLNRGVVKITDKLLIHNIDTGVTEYVTVQQLLAALAIYGKVGFGTTSPIKNFHIKSATSESSMDLENDARDYRIGVYDFGAGLDRLFIRDNTAGQTRFVLDENGNVGIDTSSPTSKLHVVGLPVYADNAAAILGGLTAGAFYRTGGDPDPVCVVH